MKQFLFAVAAMLSLSACGGGGGGSATATNGDVSVTCSAVNLSSATCDGQAVSLGDIDSVVDNGDGTYSVVFAGETWTVTPDNYASNVLLDVFSAHTDGIKGSGINIVTVDHFSGEGADHGPEVKGIIDFIAPSANSYSYDVVTGTGYTGDSQVANLSLGGYAHNVGDPDYVTTYTDQETTWSSSFTHAKDNDMAVVIAAGNHQQQGADCSIRDKCNQIAVVGYDYAVDNVIVVGAVHYEGKYMESYSTEAGVLKDVYIVAPVASENAGTSFAAPVVTGTIALIMDKFDDTSGSNAIDIVLKTADGGGSCKGNVESVSGVYCADDRVGRGRLNVGRALSPVGAVD